MNRATTSGAGWRSNAGTPGDSCARRPAAVAPAVILLGVAVGASLSAFAVVDAFRFRTIVAPEPDRVVSPCR